MESPFNEAFRNDFAIAQNPPDVPIQDHCLPILGEYRRTTSFKMFATSPYTYLAEPYHPATTM
jgi:hypothetical protein